MESHSISPDIWTEILSHLPVKSLLRFRSVCQQWKSIIDNHNFRSLHLSHCPNNRLESQLILHERNRGWLSIEILNRCSESESLVARRSLTLGNSPSTLAVEVDSLLADQFWPLNPPGEADGLLLLQRKEQPDCILWNPSIRKSIVISPPPSPSTVPVLCLGFDPSTNDYKVVNITYDEQTVTPQIFSLASRLWRKGTTSAFSLLMAHPSEYLSLPSEYLPHLSEYLSLPSEYLSHPSKKVSIQGVVNWIGYGTFDALLFSFNMISETLSYTLLPFPYAEILHGNVTGLVVPRDQLCDIWMLETDGRWSRRFTVDIAYSPFYYRFYLYNCGVLVCGVLDWRSLDNECATVAATDLNAANKTYIFLRAGSLYFGPYIESLVLLT